MSDPQTCDACGQPILIPLRMLNCDKCGVALMQEGGRYAKVKGVCLPFCFSCAAVADKAENALEGTNNG